MKDDYPGLLSNLLSFVRGRIPSTFGIGISEITYSPSATAAALPEEDWRQFVGLEWRSRGAV